MKKRLQRLATIVPFLLVLPVTVAAVRAHPTPTLWLPAALPALASSLESLESSKSFDGGHSWPVDGPVVHPFDPPPKPWLPGHRGVDLAAPQGSLVRAAADGVVLFAGMIASRPVVSIVHRNGTRTTYEPVQPVVSAGEAVDAGDVIGTLLAGHPGCGNPCLHWGLRQDEDYLDPMSLLGRTRARLLPVGAQRTL